MIGRIQLMLLVTYGFVGLGVLVVFQQNTWRLPAWLWGGLILAGVVLIGWASWTNHRWERRR